MPNLVIRLISALVMIPIALTMIWLGGWPFVVFMVLGGLLVLHEWRGITNSSRFSFYASASALVASAILCALAFVIPSLAVIFGVAGLLFLHGRWTGATDYLWCSTGVFYSSIPIFSLILLRSDPDVGFIAVVYVMIVVWVTDSTAYGAGRTIGGAKLWPTVSPNKTWAGLIGGAIGAAIAAWIVSTFILGSSALGLSLLGAFLAIVSQGGDLAESALKRHFGVKDSGSILPGHGGIMDRVDGLIAASVCAAAIGVAHAGFEQAAFGLLFWR